jgi:large subunit ribosomal protein L15
MSLLSNLTYKKGSQQGRKRVGRGDGSGTGGTAGMGHKGQKARSGKGKMGRAFEGGQTPLARRSPKIGFTNTQFKNNYCVISLDTLAKFDGVITPELLVQGGAARKGMVKVLAKGTISKAITVKAHKFSSKAKQLIEAAGGKAEVIE